MREPFVNFIRDNFTPPVSVNINKSAGKKRIEFIDLAKGVCILMVVLYHAEIGTGLPAIKALRMPLYFMLSGLFFKDYGSFLNFTEKKINKILVPFLFFVLLGFFVKSVSDLSLGRPVDWSCLFQPFREPDMVNLPVWFLICLFWANLIYCGISIHIRSMAGRTLAVFLFGALGYLCHRFQVYLPLFLASSFTALPFFYAGSLLRKFPLLYPNSHDRLSLWLGVVLLAICVAYCFYVENPFIAFRSNLYEGNPFVIFPLSVSLVVGLLLLCKSVRWLPVVSYLGRYSIIVLGLHYIILENEYFPVDLLESSKVVRLGCFAFSVFVCWLAIPLCRAFLPKLTAQADWLRLPQR